ncbi:MAG: thiol:disulfide interchange protein DsbA/DsbL [Sulfuritalea sp.]|nr:thiol:disulfide interchange protein DsbA/DsbL [Sulfuritalea sp.]MDP1985348.1 thiol:disulfide interchange protein DsbA/DsbL [Sulfuritalea sp.]
MKRLVALLSATLLAWIALPGLGFAAEPQFKAINPPMATAKDKIEVIEFFSYGCPHCSDFHPLISQWAAKLPKDVTFRRVPVSFNRPEWARLSRLFFAIETSSDLAKLDTAAFRAIHEERVNLTKSDEAVIAWAVSKGADGKKMKNAMDSFSMQSRLQRADKETADAHVEGVPSLVVDGKFLLERTTSYEELLQRTDSVIAKARRERTGK